MGVFDRRRRGGEDVRRHDALSQVVDAFEAIAPPGDAEVAGPEQPFEGRLAVGPAPPRSLGGPAVGQVAGGDRAAVAHLAEDGRDVAGSVALDAVDIAPPSITQVDPCASAKRVRRHGHQAGGVAPVLEQLAVPLGALLDQRPRIGTEPGEGGQLVGPDQGVDRIDLDEADPIDQAAQVAAADATRGPCLGEALRGQRDAPRGRGRDPGK